MISRLKKENKEFANNWRVYHQKGFLKYFSEKILKFGIMMLMLYTFNILIHKNINYPVLSFIYITITIILPTMAWKINEIRYNISEKSK